MRNYSRRRKLSKIPNPPQNPITGHLYLFNKPETQPKPWITLHNLAKEYGPMLYIRFGAIFDGRL